MIHSLAALAENRFGPDEKSISELESYCRDFPYCQPAQMLLAIARNKYGQDTDGAYIHRAMIYAPDQRVFAMHQQEIIRSNKAQDEKPERPQSGARPELDYVTSVPVMEAAILERIAIKEGDSSKLNEKQQKQQAIIDRFLDVNPRITSDTDILQEKDITDRALEEDPGLVSETLAEILLKQGKSDKALGIYERLCLKYPEKSSYFAKKIEDIKNSIK